jgi:hypothetical protein
MMLRRHEFVCRGPSRWRNDGRRDFWRGHVGQRSGEGGDAPLIDLNEASIKKLIARAKRRGVITYDELNEACLRTCRRSDRGHHGR